MTQRSLEDDLFGAEYLAHHSDFARGVKYGEAREQKRIIKILKKHKNMKEICNIIRFILQN